MTAATDIPARPASAAAADTDLLLDIWTGDEEPDADDAAPLHDALGTSRGLAVRDMLVVVAIDPTLPRDRARLLADRDHTKEALKTMGGILTDWYEHDPFAHASREHHERMSARAERLARLSGDRCTQAQLLAVAAYLAWPTDLGRAMALAIQSLAADDSVSLAAIIIAAIGRGCQPGHATDR